MLERLGNFHCGIALGEGHTVGERANGSAGLGMDEIVACPIADKKVVVGESERRDRCIAMGCNVGQPSLVIDKSHELAILIKQGHAILELRHIVVLQRHHYLFLRIHHSVLTVQGDDIVAVTKKFDTGIFRMENPLRYLSRQHRRHHQQYN